MKKLTWLLFFFSLSGFSTMLESMHTKENSSSKSSIDSKSGIDAVEKKNVKSSAQSKPQPNNHPYSVSTIMMLYHIKGLCFLGQYP